MLSAWQFGFLYLDACRGLANVPMYISAGGKLIRWGGCLYLRREVAQLIRIQYSFTRRPLGGYLYP